MKLFFGHHRRPKAITPDPQPVQPPPIQQTWEKWLMDAPQQTRMVDFRRYSCCEPTKVECRLMAYSKNGNGALTLNSTFEGDTADEAFQGALARLEQPAIQEPQ
jgi:hypothetical protein